MITISVLLLLVLVWRILSIIKSNNRTIERAFKEIHIYINTKEKTNVFKKRVKR